MIFKHVGEEEFWKAVYLAVVAVTKGGAGMEEPLIWADIAVEKLRERRGDYPPLGPLYWKALSDALKVGPANE